MKKTFSFLIVIGLLTSCATTGFYHSYQTQNTYVYKKSGIVYKVTTTVTRQVDTLKIDKK